MYPVYELSDGVQKASGAFTVLLTTGGHTTALELAQFIATRDQSTTYVWYRPALTLVLLMATVSPDGTVTHCERNY